MEDDPHVVPWLIHEGRWVANARYLILVEQLERHGAGPEVEVQMLSGTRFRLHDEEAIRFWDRLIKMVPSPPGDVGSGSVFRAEVQPRSPGIAPPSVEPGSSVGG